MIRLHSQSLYQNPHTASNPGFVQELNLTYQNNETVLSTISSRSLFGKLNLDVMKTRTQNLKGSCPKRINLGDGGSGHAILRYLNL